MKALVAVVMIGGVAALQYSIPSAYAQISGTPSSIRATAGAGAIPAIPPPPKGKSTIMGGEIQRIDPVRDELTLKVYGQRPVKILFDERTQVFSDGKKLALHELGPANHASVQTLLDGTNVYALSIHILTRTPEGEYQGVVQGYDSATNQLTISSVLFHEPLKLTVPPGTPVVRVGQSGFTAQQNAGTDLARGSLISVQFSPDNSGHGIASHISVLATPGSSFVFIGTIASLDAHSGRMTIVDAQDDKDYQVTFASAELPKSESLRIGDNVMVSANFSGDHYVASAITINK